MKNNEKNNFLEKKLSSDLIKKTIIFSLIGAILICSLLLAALIWNNHINILGDINENLLGAIGDFVGGIIGTMFTIIATLLVWITYNSQKKELELTRKLVQSQTRSNHLPNFHVSPVTYPTELSRNKQNDNHTHARIQNVGTNLAKNLIYLFTIDASILLKFLKELKKKFDLEFDHLDFVKAESKIEIGFSGEDFEMKLSQSSDQFAHFSHIIRQDEISSLIIDSNILKFIFSIGRSLKSRSEKKSFITLFNELETFYIHLHYQNTLGETLTQKISLNILNIKEVEMDLNFKDQGTTILSI